MKYLELFERFNSEITFEILDYNYNDYNDDIILEKRYSDPLSFYDQTINGKVEKTDLNSKQIDRLRTIKRLVDIRLSDINDIEGNYINNLNQPIKRYFNITYDNHWVRKFLRQDIEDPYKSKKIVNPGTYEAIDLMYNNRDKLTEYVFNKILKDHFKVLARATNKEGYELIFIIKSLTKKSYNIYFKTQMKGLGHNYKYYNPRKDPIDRIIKLHPDGIKKPLPIG